MTSLDRLTQTHRAQQLLLRRATVGQMRALWPALDWAALDASFPEFALRVASLVQANRSTSTGLASAYLRALRQASGVSGPVSVVLAEPVDADALVTSLRVTSVITAKKAAAAGASQSVAMGNALTLVEGAAARMVLNGGRETILATGRNDPHTARYRRVLGGAGCDFCRMLAGRGAVYYEDSGGFEAHDKCGCTAAPEYG